MQSNPVHFLVHYSHASRLYILLRNATLYYYAVAQCCQVIAVLSTDQGKIVSLLRISSATTITSFVGVVHTHDIVNYCVIVWKFCEEFNLTVHAVDTF